MKNITVVRANEVESKPFVLDDFTVDKAKSDSMKKITKKELKILAKELGLDYDNENLTFARKLLNAHIKRNA